MPPFVPDTLAVVKPFIELARGRGVERFGLMSVLATERGMVAHGKVHEYLVDELAQSDKSVGWAILRSSWFMDMSGAVSSNSVSLSLDAETDVDVFSQITSSSSSDALFVSITKSLLRLETEVLGLSIPTILLI
jgi:hypothetical protein